MAVESLASDLIATLDKRAVLTYLRGMRGASRNKTEIDVFNMVIQAVESGNFDG